MAEFSVCVSVPARPLRPDGAMSLDPARGAAPPHGLRHRGAAVLCVYGAAQEEEEEGGGNASCGTPLWGGLGTAATGE